MTLIRLFILLITLIILQSRLCAEEIAEDIIEEWDNTEIEINEPQGNWDDGMSLKSLKMPRIKPQSQQNTSTNIKKTDKKKISVKEKTPITRPILYRYIYINPNAERLKAEARMKKEARNKEIK